MEKKLINIVANELSPLVNAFQVLQDKKGCVIGDLELANKLILEILRITENVCQLMSKTELYKLISEDVGNWLEKGLQTKPSFVNVAKAMMMPENGELFFILAPTKCPNSLNENGYYLECILASPYAPDSVIKLKGLLSHKKRNPFQTTRFMAGSNGITRGNCVVLFPENIACNYEISIQGYAIFFFNKFKKIYERETLPSAKKLFNVNINNLASYRLSEEEAYSARCVWGYLHDYFHHKGIRPLDENLRIKTGWYTGLLEEVKVDMQSALLCLDSKVDIPNGDIVYEYILLDRLARYPLQVDSRNNFDAGTGFLILSWLIDENALEINNNKYSLDIRSEKIQKSISKLIKAIESIEAIVDDEKYEEEAKRFTKCYLGSERAKMAQETIEAKSSFTYSIPGLKVVNDFYEVSYARKA